MTHPRSCHPLLMDGALGAVQVSRCRRIIELRPVSRTPKKGVFGSDQGEERTFLTAALGGLRNGGYPLLKSGRCFSTHVMNETASPLSDLPSGVSS